MEKPWNFRGPDGSNLILGKVIKEISNTCIVFEADREIEFKENKGRKLLLSTRYEGETLKVEGGYGGVITGGFLQTDDFNKSCGSLEAESIYVLIGSIEKLEVQ